MDVSVIIPCYNREHSIKGAVLSVLNQIGNHNIEIIVVDDGSTDQSIEKINDLGVKILKTNGRTGACNARNIGIEAATHEWIAFNDSDDFWRADKLECIEKTMLLKNIDFIFHPFIRSVGLKVKIGGVYKDSMEIVDKKDFVNVLLTKNMISTQCLIARKNVLVECGMFDVKLQRFQDWDLALRLANRSTGLYISEFLCICVESIDSISKGFKKGILSRHYLLNKHHNIYIKNRFAMLKFRISLKIRECISFLMRG